jgi:AraC family transcriptional regulator
MELQRRTLFDGSTVRVDDVLARPASSACGEIESRRANILVLPLAGVFAKHDSPREHVIATPNHAVFIAADRPFRLSYPGAVGDRVMALWFPRLDLDFSDCASQTLLPPAAMLSRSLLWRKFARGDWDALEVEELGIRLLTSSLHAGRRHPHAKRRRLRHGRRLRQVERVKEAISLQPERKWTLTELAGIASVSASHLAHVFRDEVGASVYGYVLRSRLARALQVVLDADTDLTEIALEAGFASHSHFTARFRALYGVTPLGLRRAASARQAAELRRIVTARSAAAV